jgi:hypothetical protein
MKEEYNIDELVASLDIKKNMLTKVNDKINLTNYQIDCLKRNNIDIYHASSLKEIIYLAEEAYEETLDEELDIILGELSERNYYENTNK